MHVAQCLRTRSNFFSLWLSKIISHSVSPSYRVRCQINERHEVSLQLSLMLDDKIGGFHHSEK